MIISEWITNKWKEKGNVEMSDIEKKLEALKAEFSGKLEELEKEAEMRKKQEELKPWKPERREEYFFVDNDFFPHLRLATVYARKNVLNKSQRKCGYCYGLSSCMICSVRIMCRTGKMKKISFVSATTMRESNGAWKAGFFLKVKDLCGLILLRTPKKQRKS